MKRYPPRRASLYDQSKEALRPVIGLDIDGTLGEYHEHFWRFACAWVGRELPHPDGYKGGSFAKYLGLAKSTYRKIKLAYRRGGLKRSMPVRDGAPELARGLRRRGALVILCTTRPYLSLENIDEDTRHWAKRNKIEHDAIIWGEHKYKELSRFGSRVVAALDDEPALINSGISAGVPMVRMSRPYNIDLAVHRTHEWVVFDCRDAQGILGLMLTRWEEKNL